MGPAESIRTCTIKSFQYSGRASRSEYWWFLPVGAALPLSALMTLHMLMPSASFLTFCAIGFLTLSPLMAVTKRRLADTGETAAWFETPLTALVFFLLASWADYALNTWAFRMWDAGADGPDGFAIWVVWALGNLVLLPVMLHQFFVGLITGSALFTQMAVPSRRAESNHRPNPSEAPR